MASKLILTHEVTGLGEPGDVVEVKDGYARNFLLPRKLATPWTKGGQKQIDQITTARRKREISSVEDAQAAAQRLTAEYIKVQARAGEGGRLFGAVTTAEIADAVAQAGGPQVDKRKIIVGQPIKSLGEHKVTIKLHQKVSANVTVQVVAAK